MDLTANSRSVSGCKLVADVARRFGEVRIKVTGASMIPAVWPGDVIGVCRRQTAELRPGTMVLYRRDESLIAHRVKRVSGACLITRGDSLPDNDPPIGASEIVGEVVFLERNGRLIRPRQTFLHRAGSFVLRRSNFSRRMVLHLGLRIIRLGAKETACAS